MTPTRKTGRPSKLNASTQEALVMALENGCYRETAVRAAGIGMTTFQRWLEQGEADEEQGVDTAHRTLRAAVLLAEARGEANAVKLIRESAVTTWQAAAWLLERKYPDRWGRRERHAVEAALPAAQSDGEVVHNKVVEVTPEEEQRLAVARILGGAMGMSPNGQN